MKEIIIKSQKTLFIIEDSDIIIESILEDVANILNNGDTPNLF